MTPADLRAARLALGITQRELARRLDVSKDVLNRWERGRNTIQHPAILRLALERLGEKE